MKELAIQVGVVLLSVIFAMAGFWLMIGREFTTRAEVSQMIEETAPYLRDRQLIQVTLSDQKQVTSDLRDAIQQNTKALIKLEAMLGMVVERSRGGEGE